MTPSYNQALYIEETICSVLQQRYPNLEYIVMDGGSTDKSVKIIQKYASDIEYWVSEPDHGQADAINKGWQRASGDVLGWLNSDDTLVPGALGTIQEFLISHPEVDIVFGDTLFTGADGSPLRRSKPREAFDYVRFVLTGDNIIPQPSAFVRRSVLEDIGFLDPAFHYLMDWDFWLRAGLDHRVAYLPALLSTYRLHPASKSTAQTSSIAAELQRMYHSYFARADLPRAVRQQQRPAMANMYFTSGNYYMEGGDAASAARAARLALAQYPALLLNPSMAHKFLFCLLGHTPPYAQARKILYRARSGV